MARIRTIKPEFWHDKRVASWPYFTRLLFIGLWSAADDFGRGSAEPARIAAELFPYDLSRDPRETLARVSEALATLSDEGRIVVYEVEDETYFEVANWEKHQRVDKPGKSKIPSVSDGFARPSRDSRESVARPSRLEQGTGNREMEEQEAIASSTEIAADAATPRTSPDDGSPVVMEFPCSGNPKTWALRQDRIDRWQEAFPAVDVRAELLKARTWLEDRPRNRKTAAGMPRFLGSWMGRSQDRSGSSAHPSSSPQTIADRVRAKLAMIPITDGSDRE